MCGGELIDASLQGSFSTHPTPTRLQPGNGEKLWFSPPFQEQNNVPRQGGTKSFPPFAFLFCFDPLVRLNPITSHSILAKHIPRFPLSVCSGPEKFLEGWQARSASITQSYLSFPIFLLKGPLIWKQREV